MLHRLDADSDIYAPQEAESGFDLHGALNFVWRQWKLICGVTALALLVGAVYVARATPLYTATAQLLLDPRKEKAVGQDAIISDVNLDLPIVESQIAVLKSSALLRHVVAKERLVNDAEFGAAPLGDSGGGLLAKVRSFFSRPAQGGKDDKAQAEAASSSLDAMAPEAAATLENLRNAVIVARAGQAYVLAVSVTSADPAKAARLSNAVADAYVVDKLDARFEAAKRASAWLSDRLVELRQQLRESEEAVARYRADNNLPASGGANPTLNQEQLGQLNARLVAARAETAERKARLDILQRVEARGGSPASLLDTLSSGAIADLRKQAAEISRQEADLLARYSANHPSVVNLRAQAADVRRAIAAEAPRLAANIRNDYELARAREEAVEQTLREVTGRTDLDSSKMIMLRELERTAAVNKSLFEDFLQRARVTQEQSTFEARDARVITPAVAPPSPTSPKKAQVMLVALLVGFALGGGGAYAMELLNAGFTTPRQVEDVLRLPLLASISRIETHDLSLNNQTLTIPEYPIVKPLSRLSEAFRSLRSAVQMCDVDHPPKVLLFTSTSSGEGKSTLALGFAGSAAQSGARVLMVDADLRHPSVSRYFKAEKETGLVELLIGDAKLEQALRYDQRLKVWFLPSGGKTQNPPDLLSSERLKALIDRLAKEFDLVVLDGPPMGPVVDPLILALLVDKVIFVVRWASTAREMVAHSIERLSGHRKVAGVVFNFVVDAQAQKYGTRSYNYYSGDSYYSRYHSE